MNHSFDILPVTETFDDFAWDSDEDIRDLIQTTPLMYDADGLPIGYEASQLFGLEATYNGTGEGTGSSSTDYGVNMAGIVSTANGDIDLTGINASTGTGNTGYGVYTQVAGGAIETTGSGNINIIGIGGSDSGAFNDGVAVTNINGVQALDNGNITITGTAGDGVGGTTSGVLISGSVAANGGNIAITGIGGNGSGNGNAGIFLNGANTAGNGVVSNTHNGSITLNGSGGSTDYGVWLGSGNNANTNGGEITAVNGNIAVTGTGGGNGSANYGVYIENFTTGSLIKTTGSGNIFVAGSGSNGSYGLYLGSANALQAAGTGRVMAIAHGSDLFLAAGGSISSNATGTAIALAAINGGNFLNYSGASALSSPNGRWLIYSTSPLADSFNGLPADFSLFGCRYGGYCPHIPSVGNGLLFSQGLTNVIPSAAILAASTESPKPPVAWQNQPSQQAAPSRSLVSYCRVEKGIKICSPL